MVQLADAEAATLRKTRELEEAKRKFAKQLSETTAELRAATQSLESGAAARASLQAELDALTSQVDAPRNPSPLATAAILVLCCGCIVCAL